jgi:hypothetical protein
VAQPCRDNFNIRQAYQLVRRQNRFDGGNEVLSK